MSNLEPWHQEPWQQLSQRAVHDRIPHAVLLTGAAGTGKRQLAAHFAAMLVCQTGTQTGVPCGTCRGCELARAGSHPDLTVLGLEEDSRQIKIDQIREVSRRVALTSSLATYQVVIVQPADRMNASAANAFLKTLEEPRRDSVLLLVADSMARLPITIRSRCQRFHVPTPDFADALQWLADKKVGNEADRAEALVLANGIPGVALQLLEKDVLDLARATRQEVQAVASGSQGPVEVAARWCAGDPDQRLGWMRAYVTAAAEGKFRPQPVSGLTVDRDLASLTQMVTDIERTKGLLESNLRPELLLEGLLVRWQHNRPETQGDAVW